MIWKFIGFIVAVPLTAFSIGVTAMIIKEVAKKRYSFRDKE